MSSRGAAKKLRPAPRPAKPAAKKAPAKKISLPKKAAPAKKASAPPPPPPPRPLAPPKPLGVARPPLVQQAVLAAKKPLPPVPPPRPPLPPKQQPTLARSFYWSELRVGDDLPPLAKPAIDRVQIARYAAAAGDFNRLHLDEPYATALGYRGAFAPGALAMGFVAQLLTQWLRRGHVRKLSARFVKIVRPGDELTCRGRIAELRKEKGACYAELELWAENQKGELVLRGHATCELYESPAAVSGDGGLFGVGGRAPTPRAPLPPPRKPLPPPLKPPPRKK